jgi:precorrin-2 dehydrogenase/sirohydrochlorin ferrochelatase
MHYKWNGRNNMYPIALDFTRIPVLLVGSGELVTRRLAQLKEAGATQVTVLEGELPSAEAIKNHSVILIAGLPRAVAEKIVQEARTQQKLVNVEDINDLCDFYFTANVTRGDLVIAVSTSGASPTLARKVRDFIAAQFGEEWASRVRELSDLRKTLKNTGASMKEVIEKTELHLKDKGWLSDKKDAA